MKSLMSMVQSATASVRAGRTDEALAQLEALEASLSKQQPVGSVGQVPILGGGVGYLHVPLPLGTLLYADRAVDAQAQDCGPEPAGLGQLR